MHGRCSARLTDLVLVDDMSDGLISKEAIVVCVQFLESRQLLRASTPQLAYSLSQAEAVGASQVDHSMSKCYRVPEPLLNFFLAGFQLTESGLAIGISRNLTQHSGNALGERNAIIERRQA